MLTAEEVQANAEAILQKFFLILDESRTEVRRQSEWFGSFTLGDVVRLAAKATVAQMLQREDFARRFEAGRPIGLHELVYPLLQGYDSVAIQADVEFGGTDQKFNILVGRELQPQFGQRPQCALLVPLLVGLDGQRKMSQSLGNYVAIDAPPHDMFGKLMSIPDHLILQYLELLTDVPDEELAELAQALEERQVNPMEVKMRLAREVVAQFHGPEAARRAEEEFVRVFREREMPEEVPEWPLPLAGGKARLAARELATALQQAHRWPVSVSEVRRLIGEGAVEVDGQRVRRESELWVWPGALLRVGKHRFLRIVDAGRGG